MLLGSIDGVKSPGLNVQEDESPGSLPGKSQLFELEEELEEPRENFWRECPER